MTDEQYGYLSGDGYKISGNVGSAIFAIGNHWHWKSFSIGCDWIGVNMPYYSNVTGQKIVSDKATLTSKWAKEDTAKYITDSAFLALNFYLGFSF